MMAARVLMLLGSSIILALGVIHLTYTFWGRKLTPRDPAVQARMTSDSPVITKETSIWRVWVGLNASHGMGLILFGLIFGYLAVAHAPLLFQSWFLRAVGLVMLAGYLALGRLYFFSVPFMGIGVSFACYVASIVVWRA
jgi:hypothetical protein